MNRFKFKCPAALPLLAAITCLALLSTSCATRLATREVRKDWSTSDPGTNCYIQSKKTFDGLPYSCSFVEFDERGDYLDFNQNEDMLDKIYNITCVNSNKLLLVFYCHGWKNDSQSDDVVKFVHFLSLLAGSNEATTKHLRVHGVYLSWRANLFRPYVEKGRHEDAYWQTTRDFGAPIVSDRYSRRLEWLMDLPEDLSFYSRLGLAEHKVSGVPIARTIFEAANMAKQSYPGSGWTNKVLVMAHSFGALMLEKSLGQAVMGQVSETWNWKDWKTNMPAISNTQIPAGASAKTLPFDCILFINSAAPSLYAKELSDFMWADQGATKSTSPKIISITSSADMATRELARWGYGLAPLYPTLQRNYDPEGLLTNAPSSLKIPQSYFYDHTPGHNPLLVDHWIVTNPPVNLPPNDFQDVLDTNLSTNTTNPNIFYTSSPHENATAWNIGRVRDANETWTYEGYYPVTRGNYWIMSCNKDLIASHTAIWTTNTMEMYAALYRLSQANPPPK